MISFPPTIAFRSIQMINNNETVRIIGASRTLKRTRVAIAYYHHDEHYPSNVVENTSTACAIVADRCPSFTSFTPVEVEKRPARSQRAPASAWPSMVTFERDVYTLAVHVPSLFNDTRNTTRPVRINRRRQTPSRQLAFVAVEWKR